MLRSSILYAAETYYNLSEKELREIERIEEGFLRKLLKTSKGCPIIQLYLTFGVIPARFQIMKMRIMFLKDILNEKEESLIRKFYELQTKKPTKGDWASTCTENLAQLKINLSIEDIKKMKRNQFKNILKQKINELAFQYLMKKKGKKGCEIEYLSLRMSDYLALITGLTILYKKPKCPSVCLSVTIFNRSTQRPRNCVNTVKQLTLNESIKSWFVHTSMSFASQ